jgi:hypothetical protein
MIKKLLWLFCFVVNSLNTNSQNLKLTYAPPWGISTLKYAGNTIIDINMGKGRAFSPEAYKVLRKDGTVEYAWSHLQSFNWNDQRKEFAASFVWGNVVCRYMQVGDTLSVNITLTNTMKDGIFCGMSFCPFAFDFGKKPANFQPSFPYFTNNISTPAVVRADMGTYQVFIENPDIGKKVYMGLLEENNTNASLYRVWNGNTSFAGMTEFDHGAELSLAPGKSFNYTMLIKFCKPEATSSVVSKKAYSNFRTNFPFKIKWPDRRPIGELFLASFTGQQFQNNPRNWIFNASELNISTPAGRTILRQKVLEYAKASIGFLKDMNAQGMITWDIEGQQFPHPLSYIGSPEILSRMAPEMDALADEYFGIFRKAGFKTGICIRPDSVVFKNNWIEHVPVKDPVSNLAKKIQYARKRWGCTIFYVDSNIDPSGKLMDYSIFKKLNERFGDILLIPEHERVLYYGYTAPFADLKMEPILVDAEIKAAYPDAFMVINVPEGLRESEQRNVQNLYNSIRQGNIFLFRAWYPDEPTNTLIKKAYQLARSK